MKLCIPLRTPLAAGECDAPLEPHLPHARFLHLYDTETRNGRTLDLQNMAQENETFRIEALLCASLDRVHLRQLLARGVQVFGTGAETLQAAVAEYERGELRVVSDESESGCGGGGGCGKKGGCGGHGNDKHHEGDECSAPREEASEAHAGCGGGGCGCGHGGAGGCGGHADESRSSPGEEPALNAQGDLRIAVCSQNRKTVTEHAGKCRKFWIYDVSAGIIAGRELIELPLEEAMHSTPAGVAHPLDGVDVLIAGSMGGGIQAKLRVRGIAPRITTITDPDAAVMAFLAGEMPAPEISAAGGGCSGGCHAH